MPTLALPLCVLCRSCGDRAAIPHKAIKAYAGNIKALSGLRLKCSKCGERSASGSGTDIEGTLAYKEGELKGFLGGAWGGALTRHIKKRSSMERPPNG
jgi:hypothetical protein